ncbi:Putative isopenicillin N synthase-like superfamily [Colletotrichum destructivum]|uniref:Isopenicillin N synthase-like superfamily n=1 Tax=Colletotrichum destructivum TaxID=34406 RepID=A0AAX4IVE0_9PEZI|nr:Putative isopenicillin N synthase-like superfamily [Colletotrichum destructivum]
MEDELFEDQYGQGGDDPLPPPPPAFSSIPDDLYSQFLSPFDTPSLLWSQSFPIALDNHPRGFMRADEIFTENGGPIPLPPRFAQIKRSLVAGKEYAIVQSWERLLVALRAEIAVIGVTKSDIIPTIDFSELQDHSRVSEFTAKLRRRGGAIIRNVVPASEAHSWREETETYLSENPHTKGWPTRDPHLFGIYWSPAQIKGRAHPNVLAAQRFLMGLWRSRGPNVPVVVDHPVSYADRLRIRTPGDEAWHLNAHVDGGSVERWESDGYGNAGTYQRIWDGRWEDYDPWDSSTRLKVTSDLYNGAGSCSMFRMFQGWLSMSDINPADGTLLLCPMLQLATAYFLLRPFFSPRNPSPTSPNFLARENWSLDFAQTSIIQGAVPSYTQELNSTLHPHLQLDKSLVRIPPVRPGDYVVWHPDMVYGVDRVPASSTPATIMYIPACPLTQTNALYLARQRKAFLLGQPSPDFGGGKGETTHMGRPGVQEVSDAGGEDGLRSMGLLPWEDTEGKSPTQKAMVGMANAILFPESYDMV